MDELLLGTEVFVLLVNTEEFILLADTEEFLLVVKEKEEDGEILNVEKDKLLLIEESRYAPLQSIGVHGECEIA